MKTSGKSIITAGYIEKCGKTFRDIGLPLRLFEEFFVCMRMISGAADDSPSDRMRELIGEYVFEGKNDLERFTETYVGFYNSVVVLLESFGESYTAEEQIARVAEVYRGFEKYSSEEEDFGGVMKTNALEFIIYLVYLSGIEPEKNKGFNEDLMRRELGDYLMEAFLQLTAIYTILNENKAGKKDLEEMFLGIVADAYMINADRKANFDPEDYAENETYRKNPSVGRNDPCPCGSGKKYKKCCLEKDENPFHDLLPVNPPLPRLTHREIEEFYGLFNMFMKRAWAMKHEADVTTMRDFCVIAQNGKYTMNPEYMSDVSAVSDLIEFIRMHLAKIISECLKTVGKDSAEGAVLSAWRSALLDHFFVMERASQGCAIFWGQNKSEKSEMFLVYGLYDDVSTITGTFPSVGEALLLPYRGRIVMGGFFKKSGLSFKRGFVNVVTDDYVAVRKGKPVLTTLR